MKTKDQYDAKAKSFATVVTVLIIIISVCYFSCGESSDTKEIVKEKPTKSDALYYSKNFVKERLKSPSTAEFGEINEATIQQLNDSAFTVINYVDCQNSFGAMLRSDYSCIIVFNSDNMINCLDLNIQQR